MRETEIVKGLAQAKRNMFAKGMAPRYATGVVPPEAPSLMGFIKDRTKATIQAILPGAPAMAKEAVMQNQGMLGGAARGLRDHQNNMDAQIKEATGFATGTPFIEGPGTGTSDSVPAMLSKGEAVLPAKTVQSIGPNNIARMIEQTNGIAPKRGLSGRTDSGTIGSDNWQHVNAGGTDSGTIGKYADGYVKPTESMRTPYVDDPVARAAANRAPQPAPTVAAEPTVAKPIVAEAPPAQSVLTNTNTIKQRAMGAFNAIRGTPAAATDAVAPAAVSGGSKLGGLAKGLGKAGLAFAPVVGAYQAATDSDANVQKEAADLGLDYNTDGGRALANTANFFEKTGNAATFGLAGALGRKLAGGNFFDNSAQPAAAAATSAAPAAPAAPTQTQPQPQTGSIGGAASAAGAGEIQNEQAPLQTLPAAQARSLDSAIRNKTIDSTDFQPGSGVVIANGNGGSAPRATMINDNRGGQRGQEQQNTQPAGPYDEVRRQLAASQMSAGDSWGDRADKLSLRRSAAMLGDTVNNEQSQQNNRYATDRGYDTAVMSKGIARAQYQRDIGNDNEKRINAQLDTLSQTTDKKGAATIDPVQRADYERKVLGTYGKNGIAKADIPQDQLNEFLSYYEANKQDPGILQKLDNFVKQRKTVTSNDVTGARAVGTESGVLVNSTVQANGNRIPTNLRHGQNIFGVGPADADLRDLDKATQAHYKKYGF